MEQKRVAESEKRRESRNRADIPRVDLSPLESGESGTSSQASLARTSERKWRGLPGVDGRATVERDGAPVREGLGSSRNLALFITASRGASTACVALCVWRVDSVKTASLRARGGGRRSSELARVRQCM